MKIICGKLPEEIGDAWQSWLANRAEEPETARIRLAGGTGPQRKESEKEDGVRITHSGIAVDNPQQLYMAVQTKYAGVSLEDFVFRSVAKVQSKTKKKKGKKRKKKVL